MFSHTKLSNNFIQASKRIVTHTNYARVYTELLFIETKRRKAF